VLLLLIIDVVNLVNIVVVFLLNHVVIVLLNHVQYFNLMYAVVKDFVALLDDYVVDL